MCIYTYISHLILLITLQGHYDNFRLQIKNQINDEVVRQTLRAPPLTKLRAGIQVKPLIQDRFLLSQEAETEPTIGRGEVKRALKTKSIWDTKDLYIYGETYYRESHRAIGKPLKIKPHVSIPESNFNPQGCNPSPVTMEISWSALKTGLTDPLSS